MTENKENKDQIQPEQEIPIEKSPIPNPQSPIPIYFLYFNQIIFLI